MHAQEMLSMFSEENLSQESIITNESVLLPEHIPSRIIGREKQLKELMFWYETILRSQRPVNVLIKGMSGTGKTLIAKYFADLLKEIADKRHIGLHTVYVDCRDCRSETEILIKVTKSLDAKFNLAGMNWANLLKELGRIIAEKGNPRILVILDEINLVIQRRETDLLYLFTRSPSHNLGSISLILIAVSASVLNKLEEIDPSTLSSLGHGPAIKMEKYTKEELVGIIGERAKLALAQDSLLKNELELIADIASKEGNARLGLEILWAAAKIADKDERSRIEPDDIRAAKNNVYSSISDIRLIDLDEQELIVLYSVAWYFDEDRYAIYAETGKIWSYYEKACKDNKIQKMSFRNFRRVLEKLGKKGLINYVQQGKGVTATISLEEVPAYVLREKIEEFMKRIELHEKLQEIEKQSEE